jgi:pimeloyl-ACP methyl ester carboxylesterase
MRILRWISLCALILLAAYATLGLLAAHGAFAKHLPASQAPAPLLTVGPPRPRNEGRAFLDGPPNPHLPLVVILHGDAPGILPRYEYLVASRVAAAAPGSRVVALLRPGYGDPFGALSDGWRGFATGENYTSQDINDLAAAIAQLKQQYNAPAVVLAGHSGGSTLTADIAALHPGLIQQAILVSCPCDVPAFRHHMARLQWSPVWLLPVHSLSPLTTLDQMQPGVTITAISGDRDPIALPQYAQAYIAKAKSRGFPASMTLLPGQDHEIFTEQPVIAAIAQAARNAATP